jgi:hypothetical protein
MFLSTKSRLKLTEKEVRVGSIFDLIREQRAENHRTAIAAIDRLSADAWIGAVVQVPTIDAKLGGLSRAGRLGLGRARGHAGIVGKRELNHRTVLFVVLLVVIFVFERELKIVILFNSQHANVAD